MVLTPRPHEWWVIGVDGGGTKTEAVLGLASADGHLPRIVASHVAGPSNLQRVPMKAATDEVAIACRALFDQIPDARQRINTACFAMSGSGNVERRQEFQQWLDQQSWAEQTHITHDARAVVAAGTPRDVGIAVIAGTGSIAYGLTADGQEARCGGWGGLVGDEGSAFAIALAGFRAALHATDGRGPATSLIAELGSWLGDHEPTQWPRLLAKSSPQQIAAAATILSAASDRGDRVASEILRAAGQELAMMVAAIAQQRFEGEPVDVALAGGVLVNCPAVRDALQAHLTELPVTMSRVCVVARPAVGAARIAATRSKMA